MTGDRETDKAIKKSIEEQLEWLKTVELRAKSRLGIKPYEIKSRIQRRLEKKRNNKI